MPGGARADVEAVLRGDELELVPDALGPCFAPGEVPLAVFDLGFDLAASKTAGVVVGVVAGGPASAAGLAEGAQVRGWSIYFGDASREVELWVVGRPEPVRYLPVALRPSPGLVRVSDQGCALDGGGT